MTLPPGRGPIPVPGIDAATDPMLARTAAELNAWVDYLSNPTTNNGPRLYRPTVEKNINNQTLVDLPAAKPLDLENDPNYRVVSALDGFATMPDEFFISAKAIAGVKESELDKAYKALAKGVFTFPPPSNHVGSTPPDDQKPNPPVHDNDLYDELGQIRIDWLSMRSGWTASEHYYAQLFEDDVIRFQVYVENGFLRIAEALVKYRAIFTKASEAMAKQMDGLTQRFSTYQESADLHIDWKSVILTGITELACAIITEGASVAFELKSLASAGAQMLGDGAKSATADKPQMDIPIDEHPFLKDTVIQYVANMAKIEQDAANAINDLWMDLNSRLSQLEQARQYVNGVTNASSTMAPQFMDYAKNWRV